MLKYFYSCCQQPNTPVFKKIELQKFLPHFLQVYYLASVSAGTSPAILACGEIFLCDRREIFPDFRRNIRLGLRRNTCVCLGEIFVCLPAPFSSTTGLPLPSCLTRPPFTTNPPQFYVQLLIPPIWISYHFCQFYEFDDGGPHVHWMFLPYNKAHVPIAIPIFPHTFFRNDLYSCNLLMLKPSYLPNIFSVVPEEICRIVG